MAAMLLIVNAAGAVATGIGPAVVVVAVALIAVMLGVFTAHLRRRVDHVPLEQPWLPAEPHIRTYVLVSHTWPGTNRAIRYAELLDPVEITCVHVEEGRADEFRLDWVGLYPKYPLTVISSRHGDLLHPLRAYLRDERAAHPGGFMTVVVPEVARSRHWWQLLTHHHALQIKAGLAHEGGLTVTDLVFVPSLLRAADEPPVPEVRRRVAVVPIDDVAPPTLRAVSYAQATSPCELHIVHADTHQKHSAALGEQWEQEMPGMPLEILPSQRRTRVGPVVGYVRSLRNRAEPGTIINVILPECIMPTRLGQLLHNRTGLALKAKLLFEPDIAVTSSPWHLPSRRRNARGARDTRHV